MRYPVAKWRIIRGAVNRLYRFVVVRAGNEPFETVANQAQDRLVFPHDSDHSPGILASVGPRARCKALC